MEMTKIKLKVPADMARECQEEHEEMGMGGMIEVVPTSLYGQRTMYPKNTDLKEVEKDIQEVYGLE